MIILPAWLSESVDMVELLSGSAQCSGLPPGTLFNSKVQGDLEKL